MSGLFYYDRDYYSAIAVVPFPIIVSFSCKFYRDSCTAIARCIAFVIVLSRLLFADGLCYIAITLSLSRWLGVRCLHGDRDSCIAIVVLSLHCCIAIVTVSCCIAIVI